MKVVCFSAPLTQTNAPPSTDPINLFMQFYIDAHRGRQKEIVQCLQYNVDNPLIHKIYLLNERIYKPRELGVTSTDKIVQINLGKRLQYGDVYRYINDQQITGYNILANSDIFFDETLGALYKSDLAGERRKMVALLRYEYNPGNKYNSMVFGPRYDSQDTWIIHSRHTPTQYKLFAFPLGKPGCDNKLVYLMRMLDFEVVNDPLTLKSFHYHTSNIRNYTHDKKEVIPMPWGVVVPATYKLNTMTDSLGLRIQTLDALRFEDHDVLREYVSGKLSRGERFVIPRISTIETELAHYGRLLKNNPEPNVTAGFFAELKEKRMPIMKNNAGVQISNVGSLYKYSDMYLGAFENCEIYGGWDKQGHVYPCVARAQDFIETDLVKQKRMIWGFAFDIFHYISCAQPWTHALRGKRLLIISAFETSIQAKLPVLSQIYGRDLFPECSFLTIRPPQTQGAEPSQEFDTELNNFFQRLDVLRGQYDVALVACGGYGACVVNYIYTQHKASAIYVGGVLQMYFGILGSRWLRERPDVVRLFLNEHWTRPSAGEKPANFDKVEGSCYW